MTKERLNEEDLTPEAEALLKDFLSCKDINDFRKNYAFTGYSKTFVVKMFNEVSNIFNNCHVLDRIECFKQGYRLGKKEGEK